jgi:serine/threonine kinase 16
VEENQSDEGDELFPQLDGSHSYNKSMNIPLMTKHHVEGGGVVILDDDGEVSAIRTARNGNVPQGECPPGFETRVEVFFDLLQLHL